jgi:hypothetical protein
MNKVGCHFTNLFDTSREEYGLFLAPKLLPDVFLSQMD